MGKDESGCKGSGTETAKSKHARLRAGSNEPGCRKSGASRPKPVRAMLCKDKELSKWQHSVTDRANAKPEHDRPETKVADPQQTEDLTSGEDPG